MNTDAIIDQVQTNLNRTDATTAMVLQWLNNRKDQICNLEDFGFMEETATASTVDGQQNYSLPMDYKAELQLWLVSGTTKVPLIKWVGSEAEKSYGETTTESRPFAYWLWNDQYFLYPIPDGVYTLYIKYYRYLDDCTDTASEENELCEYWPDLLINGATSDGFHYFQQADKAVEWDGKWNTELAKLVRRTVKRKYTNYTPRLKLRMK